MNERSVNCNRWASATVNGMRLSRFWQLFGDCETQMRFGFCSIVSSVLKSHRTTLDLRSRLKGIKVNRIVRSSCRRLHSTGHHEWHNNPAYSAAGQPSCFNGGSFEYYLTKIYGICKCVCVCVICALLKANGSPF